MTVERSLIVINKSELEATNFRSSMHAKQKLEDTSVGTLTIETIFEFVTKSIGVSTSDCPSKRLTLFYTHYCALKS